MSDGAAREVVDAVARGTADPDLRRAVEQAARQKRVEPSLLERLESRDPGDPHGPPASRTT